MSNHRADSEALVGKQILISEIESQLKGIKDSFTSALVKPNSGLSVEILKP